MNFEIRPALVKAFIGFSSRDVEYVLVDVIDLRERLDQVGGVAFVASELRPNRMRIDGDPQRSSPFKVCTSNSLGLTAISAYLLFAAAEACDSSVC